MMMMLAGLLMALPGAAEDSPLPSVDLGVRELGAWSLSLVSRRTDTDWWCQPRTISGSMTWSELAGARGYVARPDASTAATTPERPGRS
ncbi:hypothetical protein F0U60_44060 [Archangium minus]|uniref:Uncharacterized protein n=1 Tax=Archangium minus TaxID=83450 RepID=A0ABY9X4L1_9BACT|nr:hypothetical protein F0U60_44060 [Archangium minus]